ncbi:MAG: amidohydrolase family protein [Lentisphaerae bacterium]|jgi:hypothetical protein|nr:amidohydrolase family protein [Lentisphaerota bacterium]MBT4818611.1 amidohydrolase family protein [Lentisphaerota bacterium]MBT5605691.1 amidohydrolase family protein [Lentisphaerota bacterium]MBT7060519.1 amidohydrolase family protein [Lentisphaerota bacterium]MBT7844426.1 amidohydrolase family protein [Lentisphaerota bacterium]
MTTRLFDIQTGFGGVKKGQTTPIALEDCLETMAKLGIAKALVRIIPDAQEVDVCMANDRLFGACAKHPELVPCPIAVPATGRDLPDEDTQVVGFLDHNSGAAVIRPAQDYWQLTPWGSDDLFKAMAGRALPLVCPGGYVSLRDIGAIAGRFPDLPLIATEVGYRDHRTILPLLETFPNVHLSIGNNWTVHRGLEKTIEAIGPEQLLFGTGFPAAEPTMALTQLMYADISDEHRRLIAAGNMERLQNARVIQ